MNSLVRPLGLLLALLVVAAAVPADAGTWKVGRGPNDCDGPCNFCDTCTPGSEVGSGILDAMNSVSVISGDTVLVWPGSISGGYTFKFDVKSGVTLMAYDYPDSVVQIIGQAGAEPGIRLIATNELTRVIGFHITWDSGNIGTGLGGGLSAFVADGEVRDNVFVNCQAGLGAGIYMQTSDILVNNNLFLDNNNVSGGGVVAISGGAPTLQNNTFVNSVSPFGTDASAVYSSGSDFTMHNNIVVGSLGAAAVYCIGANQPDIACNLFHGNELGAFAGTCPDSTGTSGNFIADPLLCGTGVEPNALCANSPALNGPCGAIGYQSPFGNCPACQVSTGSSVNLEVSSWGRVKAAYR